MRTRGMRSTALPILRSLGGVAAFAALAAAAAACGGGGDGEQDDAAKLVRNQTSGSCDAAPLPPSTLTPLGLNPLGIATLTAQPEPKEGEKKPSDQVAAEVEAAARNFVNCWNQRRFEAAVALTTEDYHKSHFVLNNPSDILVVLAGAPDLPYTVRSLGDVLEHDDGRVSAAIEYTWVHQQIAARWFFVKEDGRWMFDQETRTPVNIGAQNTVVDIDMTEFAYAIKTPKVKKAEAITLRARNAGTLPHEIFLVKLSANIDPTKLFQPGVKPEGVEFFGHTVEMAGHTGEVTITGMQPGDYIMVCQFRFPGGDLATHSAGGMVGVLTVEP
jgi:hypothetical protein